MVPAPAPDEWTATEDSILLRRVPPLWRVNDHAGGTRLSSAAFQPKPDESGAFSGISVLVEEKLRELGFTAENIVASYPGYGVVAIEARHFLDLGLEIVIAPSAAEGDFAPAHANILVAKLKDSQKKALASACERRLWPDMDDLE